MDITKLKINQYFVSDAELLKDGVLRVHWCGTDGFHLATGVKDVSPDSSDYKFWLWLTHKFKRRWYQLGARPGLNEQAIAGYRQEYGQECA